MAYQLLFADDSATMHRVLQITFAKEDFQITGVTSGQAALAKAKELRPDVAVIDISMPGMDGYTVCQSLKADPDTAQIPVLLLAGSQEPFDEGRAQASGASSHVVKPFETQVLIDRVKTLVGAPVTTVGTAPRAPAAPPQPPQVTPAAQPTPIAARPGVPSTVSTPPVQQPQPAARAPTPLGSIADAPAATAAGGVGGGIPAAAAWAPPVAGAGAPKPPPAPPAIARPAAPVAQAPAAHPDVLGSFGGAIPSIPNTPSTPSSFGQPGAFTPTRPALPQQPAATPTPSAFTPVARPAAPPATPAPTPAAAAPVVPPARPAPTPVAVPVRAEPVRPASAAPSLSQLAATHVAATADATGLPIDQAALQAMAREILEQVIWDVVPDMARELILEHIDQLAKAR